MLQNELVDALLINGIKEELLLRKETISVGESVTSGLVQAAFSQAEDAMQFYQGDEVVEKDQPFRLQLLYVRELLEALAQHLRPNPKGS